MISELFLKILKSRLYFKIRCAILRIVQKCKKDVDVMKEFFRTHKHIWVASYALIYMPWFLWLESRANQPYHVIHMALDDIIPFVEYFIVPYFLWFLYVPAVFLYLFFKNKKEFYQYTVFAFTGMTLFLIISTIYPNGHLLRPTEFERQNIFTACVQFLYQADTSTNIFPSLHVFNSVAAHMAVVNNERLKSSPWIRGGSLVLMVSIILATMFLKQHSSLDVIAGILLGIVMDQLVYHTDFDALGEQRRERKNRRKRVVV